MELTAGVPKAPLVAIPAGAAVMVSPTVGDPNAPPVAIPVGVTVVDPAATVTVGDPNASPVPMPVGDVARDRARTTAPNASPLGMPVRAVDRDRPTVGDPNASPEETAVGVTVVEVAPGSRAMVNALMFVADGLVVIVPDPYEPAAPTVW